MFLGDMMHRYAFLTDILTIIPGDFDAIQMYGHMNRDVAQHAIDDVLRLIR